MLRPSLCNQFACVGDDSDDVAAVPAIGAPAIPQDDEYKRGRNSIKSRDGTVRLTLYHHEILMTDDY